MIEAWETGNQLINEGVEMKAITAWSLFGAYGWDSLLTSEKMDYEPGVFDIRPGEPRSTALTAVLSTLSSGVEYNHPVLQQKGWWHRDTRFKRSDVVNHKPGSFLENNIQPILIIGKNGTLGRAFARCCNSRAIDYLLLGREELDITNTSQIESAIIQYSPWAIINAAGYVKVDDAESDSDLCFKVNTVGPHFLAIACKKYNIQLITFSSDMVFDGAKRGGYYEQDNTNPKNIYGKSKVDAESFVINENPNAMIIRTSAFFGPWDKYNFVYSALNTIADNKPFIAVDDIIISPTYIPDLVNVSLDLLIDKEKGIWHLANAGETTWAQLAVAVASRAGLDIDLVLPKPQQMMGFSANRPAYSVLKSKNGVLLPSLENALDRFFEEKRKVALQTINAG